MPLEARSLIEPWVAYKVKYSFANIPLVAASERGLAKTFLVSRLQPLLKRCSEKIYAVL